jgi:3-ketosteroid 9alpha-monooxygenase subunit B
MTTSPAEARDTDSARDRGFHRLRVGRVVRETADAASFVLEIPAPLRPTFRYRAGQYCTFRVWIDGRPIERCYSMSSAPEVDADLQVTVKRVAGGPISNWMNDSLRAGDHVEVGRPLGRFRLRDGDADIVAFCAGSGITPVFSLVKSALATTDRRVRLLYANRDEQSVIFGAALASLTAHHPDRLRITHHLDRERGLLTPGALHPHVEAADNADVYLCGPAPFMDLVESALLTGGVDGDRILTERFVTTRAAAAPPADDGTATGQSATVTIELDGRVRTTGHRSGTTILQAARQVDLAPPFSCEAGNCATCLARLVEGHAAMRVNDALSDEEVAAGWVLTCQAVPTTPSVRVVYRYEED